MYTLAFFPVEIANFFTITGYKPKRTCKHHHHNFINLQTPVSPVSPKDPIPQSQTFLSAKYILGPYLELSGPGTGLFIDGFHSTFHHRNWRAKGSCDVDINQHGDVIPSSCLVKRCYGIHLQCIGRVFLATPDKWLQVLLYRIGTTGTCSSDYNEGKWLSETVTTMDGFHFTCPKVSQ